MVANDHFDVVRVGKHPIHDHRIGAIEGPLDLRPMLETLLESIHGLLIWLVGCGIKRRVIQDHL